MFRERHSCCYIVLTSDIDSTIKKSLFCYTIMVNFSVVGYTDYIPFPAPPLLWFSVLGSGFSIFFSRFNFLEGCTGGFV